MTVQIDLKSIVALPVSVLELLIQQDPDNYYLQQAYGRMKEAQMRAEHYLDLQNETSEQVVQMPHITRADPPAQDQDDEWFGGDEYDPPGGSGGAGMSIHAKEDEPKPIVFNE